MKLITYPFKVQQATTNIGIKLGVQQKVVYV
jgi:hypothetical protein